MSFGRMMKMMEDGITTGLCAMVGRNVPDLLTNGLWQCGGAGSYTQLDRNQLKPIRFSYVYKYQLAT